MSDEQTVTLDADLEEIFQKIDALPLGKAAELVKAMEERWGVSAPRRRPRRMNSTSS